MVLRKNIPSVWVFRPKTVAENRYFSVIGALLPGNHIIYTHLPYASQTQTDTALGPGSRSRERGRAEYQALSVHDRILVSHGFRPITKPVSLKGCLVGLSCATDARLDELLREVSEFRDRHQGGGHRAQGGGLRIQVRRADWALSQCQPWAGSEQTQEAQGIQNCGCIYPASKQ